MNRTVSNKTFNQEARALDLSDQYAFIGCGAAAILANIVVLFVLFRNKFLMKRSAFVIGLAFGDVINGLALLITGVKRIEYLKKGISNSSISLFACLQGFTTLWLIGNQIPTVMMFLIGCERVIAVVCFAWYYKKWTNQMAWMLTGLVYVYVAGSVGTVWFINYRLPINATTTIFCYTNTVIGIGYGAYNYGLAILCGFAAITLGITSLATMILKKRVLREHKENNLMFQKFLRRQWHITRSMTCVAVFDFLLVVVPNVILLLYALKIPVPSNIGLWSADLVCSRSAISIFIYLVFNRDFRTAFLKSIGKQKLFNNQTVLPLNDVDKPGSVVQNNVSAVFT